MTILDLRPEVPRDPVGQVLKCDGYPDLAVVDLGTHVSEKLRASWREGRPPFKSGGVIDSAWLLPVLGAGGAAASSVAAGNVFLATANPATLMTIGSGVGTAVMGPTGIIAHAPFVAASTALMPVVVPVMFFMTVSSVMTCARLDQVQRSLDALMVNVDRLRQLMEADDCALFDSAAEQTDEVGKEFGHSLRFTEAMKMELVQARRDASRLCLKYGRLAKREIQSEHDAWSAVSDIHLFALSILVHLRADALRLQLTLQEDARAAARRQIALDRRVEHWAGALRALLDEHPVESFRGRLQEDRDAMNRLGRSLGRGRHLKKRIRVIDGILGSEAFKRARADLERWTDDLDASAAARGEPIDSGGESIVVCRERGAGRGLKLKAYRTNDQLLPEAA